MAGEPSLGVTGRRILVVEDDFIIASDLQSWLEEQGFMVLGPAPSTEDALALLRAASLPDAAVLDINLGDEEVFPVADALRAANVPFVFMTGYDDELIPGDYGQIRRCSKPLDRFRLLRALAEVLEP